MATCQYCGAKLSIEQDLAKAQVKGEAETRVTIQLGPITITSDSVILSPTQVYPLENIVSAKRGEEPGKRWVSLLVVIVVGLWSSYCLWHLFTTENRANFVIYVIAGVFGFFALIRAIYRLIVPKPIQYLSLQTTKWGEVVALRYKRKDMIEVISKVINRMAEKKRRSEEKTNFGFDKA